MIYHSPKEFKFIQGSKKCCVGFIDLVNSTLDTLSIIDQVKLEGYYSLFINTLSKIIKKYDGEIIKNIGDCLLFYFPKTSNVDKSNEFYKVIDCFLEILDGRNSINEHLIRENLPTYNYRITIDYGIIDFALTGKYHQLDIFGSVINICSKLNSLSKTNSITIGENFYKFLTSFPSSFEKYDVDFSGKYTITENNRYLFYTITRILNNYRHKSSKPSFHILSEKDITNNHLKEVEQLKVENKNKSVSKKIIIIDDEADIILTFKSMLENNRTKKKNNNDLYDIITFTDPELALKYLKEYINFNHNYYNNNILVILDIRMNKINGIQLYKQIKSLDSSIKLLFVTALDIIEELKSMIPGLTDDQIKKKPVEEKVLVKTVNKLLLLN